MTDPVREYGKYKTARRNITVRYEKRIGLLEVELEAKLKELDDSLSPAAKRIRDAAEAVEKEAAPEETNEPSDFVELAASLLTAPPPLPPGALIEGRENGKSKRA